MDHDEELRPRYHIGDTVVFLKKSTDEVTHTHSTEISRKNSNASDTSQPAPTEIAQINNGMSNKYKIIVAGMTCGATIAAAIISAIATYFTKC